MTPVEAPEKEIAAEGGSAVSSQPEKSLPESLQAYRESSVNLGEKFRRKSSLLLRLINIYLILTLTNLIIFWVVTGSDKIRLISEKAVLETGNIAYQIQDRLRPVMKNEKAFLNLMKKRDFRVVKEIEKSLQAFSLSASLIVNRYLLVSSRGEILHRFPAKWLSQSPNLNREMGQSVLKALQIKSLKNQAFYSLPRINDYTIEIYIPLTSALAEDVVFVTIINMPSIKQEMRSLFILAAAMIALMILVQGLFGFVLYRGVLVPIRLLVSGAERVTSEDLSVRVQTGKRADELGQLMHTFNLMVAALEEKTAKLRGTISELEAYNEIIQSELDMARDIQQGILPDSNQGEMISLGAYYAPLEKVSGDYYDIFSLPDGGIGILIADVSGHGIPAALITIMAKTHFSSYVKQIDDPAELLTRVNEELVRGISTADYMTAFYAVIHPDLSLKYANASHQKGVILRQDGTIDILRAPGFALGAVDESPIPYTTLEQSLQEGDRVVLYTDGVLEAEGPEKELYGFNRFCDKLKEFQQAPVQVQVNEIIRDMDNFASGISRRDDVTLVIVEVRKPDADRSLLLRKGAEHYKQQDFERAGMIFETLIAQQDTNVGIKWYLGNCYFLMKKYREALKMYTEYGEVKTSATLLLRMGLCHYRLDEREAARDCYRRALELREEYGEPLAQLAILAAREGNFIQARDYINRALHLKPGYSRYMNIASRIPA